MTERGGGVALTRGQKKNNLGKSVKVAQLSGCQHISGWYPICATWEENMELVHLTHVLMQFKYSSCSALVSLMLIQFSLIPVLILCFICQADL